MTEVHYFSGEEARLLLNNGSNKSYAALIGIPNAVNLISNPDMKFIASFHRATDLKDPNDEVVWYMWSNTEYRAGNGLVKMPTEEFLDWLNENYPEDLEMFLWHPELFEGRFDVL